MTPVPPRALAASHVLLVEPVDFRYNRETGATNAFQTAPPPEEEQGLSALAVEQHHRLRDLLVERRGGHPGPQPGHEPGRAVLQ